jgi:hypothetical protein
VDDCGINEASKETTAVVLMEDYICMSSGGSHFVSSFPLQVFLSFLFVQYYPYKHTLMTRQACQLIL